MTQDERTFLTSRSLPYSPHAIYAAFESARLLANWWGPDGFTNSFEVFEFKEGGRWRFQMHGPDGTSYPNESVFLVLEPARRIVIRHDCAPWFTLTVTLEEAGGVTGLTWEQVFDDVQVARAVAPVVVPANEQNLNRLERVLAAGAAGR